MKDSGIKVATYVCPACKERVGLRHRHALRLLRHETAECPKCGANDLMAGASREALSRHLRQMEEAAKKYSRIVLVTVPIILATLALHFFGKIPTPVFGAIFIVAMGVQLIGKPKRAMRSPVEIELERSS
ncbi:hypothetical protein [Halomonas organivorans]|uniref:DNA-directed RNA polymerase subunit RPC12/RpoP n=1 Tax=Halomonas organivorans TaxID=257772 RepID=A0A7W5C0H5_9GAMM|nr:hypothetical protein [Halomonas organivorans]MBB3142600.1 DNA-directed RNA polymerase subunit RPC12/RpoP [Halomonas organivorans]